MRKRQSLFLLTCFLITAGMLWGYSAFWRYFESAPIEGRMLELAQKEIEHERLQRRLLEARMLDFSQEVALRLPAEGRQKLLARGYDLAELASAVRQPAAIPTDLSGALLERGKKLFGEREFDRAQDEFRRLIDRYPSSPRVVEAYFFVAETAFLKQDFKTCLETSEIMVNQYPDHELTGFILLRVGQISESGRRLGEAAEIYSTVRRSFRHEGLREQARLMERALESP